MTPLPILLSSVAGSVRIPIRVLPRSSRTVVGGVREGRLVVRVTAPPVDRAANDAALEAISAALRLPPRSLAIVSGATSRNKVVELRGLTPQDAELRLRPLCRDETRP